MISTTTRKVSFVGNDVTTVFPFAFKVFTSADLVVVRTNTVSGVESTLILNSDYTVLLNADQDNNPGGSVTTGIALATNYTLVISSDIPNLQATEISNLGGFFPEVITNAFDKLTILDQQQQEEIDRTVKFPISDAAVATELPSVALRKGLLLGFHATTGAPVAVGGALTPNPFVGNVTGDVTGNVDGNVTGPGVSTFVETRVSGSPVYIDATAFGVKADNVTNDSTALQAAIDAGDAIARARFSGSLNTPILKLPAGRIRLGSGINLKNVAIEGTGGLDGTQIAWDGAAHGVVFTSDGANVSRKTQIRRIRFQYGNNIPDTFIKFNSNKLLDHLDVFEELQFERSYSHAMDFLGGFVNAHFHKLRFDSIGGYPIHCLATSTYANLDSWEIDDFTVDSSNAPVSSPGCFGFENLDSGAGVPYGLPACISVSNARVEGANWAAASGIVRLLPGTASNGTVGNWPVSMDSVTLGSGCNIGAWVYSDASVNTEMPTVRLNHCVSGASKPVITIAAGNYNNYTPPSVSGMVNYESDRTGSIPRYFAFRTLDVTTFDATTAGYKGRIRNDTQDRIQLFPGKIVFGPGGSTAPDTTLSRSGVGLFDINAVLGATTPAAAIVTTLVANTSIKAGSGGTAITQAKVYSQTITPAATAANTAVEQTFTVTGLTTADKVFINPGAMANACIPVCCRVTAADTLGITFLNPTAGSLTSSSVTYLITAIRS